MEEKKIERTFKSKVGWWYHLMLLILAAATVMAFVRGNSVLIISMLIGSMFAVHALLNTWYKITPEGELIVHCSIFPEKRIKIEELTAVEATVMPVASYALSLDRLIIYKGNKQWLLISPTDKKFFLKCLREHNPDIKVKEPDLS